MSNLINYLILTLRIIKNNFGKIILTLVIVISFLFVFFPFKEINDFVSSKISNLTNKSVYVQFEDLSLNPLTLSIGFEKLSVDTRSIDNLVIQSLNINPSPMALIKQQPLGSISADGLFNGQLQLKISGQSAGKSLIEVNADKMAIKDIRKVFKVKLPLNGQIQLQSKVTADMSFEEQPEGDLNLTITPFTLQSSSVNLANFGSLNVPEIKFNKIDLKARISGGKIIIESSKIGQPTDEFYGTIKGDISLKINKNKESQVITPEFGGYSFELDLTAKQSFLDKAGVFLMFLDQYKSQSTAGTQYKIKLIGHDFNSPPSMSRF